MSTHSPWSWGAGLPLFSVVALGLVLPALRGALESFGLGGDTQVGKLLTYELVLAALGLAVALLVVALVPGMSPSAFSQGALDVPASPVRLLGLGTSPGATWRSEIVSMTLVVTGVTTTFVYLANRATFSWQQALAAAPWVLLFAALNASGEEWLYRVALLRAADGLMSLQHASLLSAALFGLAHLGGMPGGLSGAVAAGLLGFVLSRATLETGGIATAWAVHFVQDVVIFAGWLGATASRPVSSRC